MAKRFLASTRLVASKEVAQPAAQALPELPGRLGEGVALEVHDAALEARLGQLVTNGGSQAGVAVGDHELDAPETATDELLEQTSP